ncbi:MAG: hypothetical protein U0350_30355 [Caldilineaceae bacterium]
MHLIWLLILSMVVGGVAILLTAITPKTSKASQAEPLANSIYLPLVARQTILSRRLGYGVTQAPVTQYPDLDSLRAGWYVDWGVNTHPALPSGIEYVQTIRVHQKLACGARHHSDRHACPYAQPLDYVYSPDAATIVTAAQANPSSLWLIGNEMDRIDWAYCAVWVGAICQQVVYDGQDEILPETYAAVYHALYTLIKQADPTAKLAIGGVIQPTPLRLAYVAKIWDSYQTQYSTTMPVDVWNVHNFIIQEKAHEYGTDIPPGIDATEGKYVNDLKTHINLTIFAQQIHAFRQWMKDHGQQNKPLIVSEYGVLYSNGLMGFSATDPQVVQNFMVGTFNYFLNTRDCDLGLPADDCRLVQRWNWYSLEDVGGTFNPYSRLFDPKSLQITDTGEEFRAYSVQYLDVLSKTGY